MWFGHLGNVSVLVIHFSFLQLLNQFENTGPPPADREKIKSLPTVQITEEHVGRLRDYCHFHFLNEINVLVLGFHHSMFSPEIRGQYFSTGAESTAFIRVIISGTLDEEQYNPIFIFGGWCRTNIPYRYRIIGKPVISIISKMVSISIW